MARIYIPLLLLFTFIFSSEAQVDLKYYLPEGFTYNPSIPTPESVLGFQVGEWHASHDQVVHYMKQLADASERVTLEVYGKTYEERPLILLTITSVSNHEKIESIKSERDKLRYAATKPTTKDMPSVVYAGYSVHGNEPSGVNAALLAAYHFAAAEEVASDLEEVVLLIDPALNPDGINRFASWVNSHKSHHMNGDPNSRELNEVWPRSRSNHYWFDLNRDWLPIQHPESKSRIRKIQEWKPNLVLDFHELETNSTYFFQPGIPSRNHPLTPQKNFEITEQIGEYHARALDKIGSLYFSKENYDDFYYGKGSSYPDVQGSIGILFEQASSRGHLQESIYGPLTFAITIRNQLTTTLSSFEAAKDMREELNSYMWEFYNEAKKESDIDTNKAVIFGSKVDAARGFHLADILLQHDIDLFRLKEDITINGVEFSKDKAYIVPFNQPQYRLINGMFESRTDFQDSLFYDVSAWTLPMAFNLEFMTLSSRIMNLANVEQVDKGLSLQKGSVKEKTTALGYAFEWGEYYTPKAAYFLMDRGYRVRVSHEDITLPEGKTMGRGSIYVDKGQSNHTNDEFFKDINLAAEDSGIEIYAVNSGYTQGVNIGSPSIDVLKKPSIAVLVEGSVSSNEAGEIWHLLDQRYQIPITLLPLNQLNFIELSRYNVLVMPNGNYRDLNKNSAEKIKSWLASGGTLIARGYALNWLDQHEVSEFKFKRESEKGEEHQKSYATFSQASGAKETGGAIFKGKLDLTHPIGYGYWNSEIFMFRSGNQFMIPSENPYANPLVYQQNPLASGYVYPHNLAQISNSGAISISGYGRGKIIGFVDNPNFRAFWFGTNKLFMNAIFFGQTIKMGTVR